MLSYVDRPRVFRPGDGAGRRFRRDGDAEMARFRLFVGVKSHVASSDDEEHSLAASKC